MPLGFPSPWAAITDCTFCIVPSLRGKEVDRSPADILAEVRSLVDDGVLEITLLGQNVNAYGVSFADPAIPRDRGAFAELLKACGDIDGLERVRFTSPHPAEFTDDVIEAMAQTPNVCPALHMPLQSGSDRILRAMRRSYRAERYLGIIERVRAAMPHAAITTDLIVGFPGETEEDFQATLDVVARARFAAAFTFQYSQRPGTPPLNSRISYRKPLCRNAICVSSTCRSGSPSSTTAPWSAKPSNFWSPPGRDARTPARHA